MIIVSFGEIRGPWGIARSFFAEICAGFSGLSVISLLALRVLIGVPKVKFFHSSLCYPSLLHSYIPSVNPYNIHIQPQSPAEDLQCPSC